jgi:hypothetical protein
VIRPLKSLARAALAVPLVAAFALRADAAFSANVLGLGVIGNPNDAGNPSEIVAAAFVDDPNLGGPPVVWVVRAGGAAEAFTLDCVEGTASPDGFGLEDGAGPHVATATIYASGVSVRNPAARILLKIVDHPSIVSDRDEVGVGDANEIVPSGSLCNAANVVASPLVAGDFVTFVPGMP